MPERDPWYKDGLSFTCRQCGNCCTGPPGYVWFTDAEGEAIAKHLKLNEPEFRRRFARRHFGKWTLGEIERDGKYDCVFLRRDEQGRALCSVYPVRPRQCRTWPFWPENLKSPAAWERASRTCEGMQLGGKFYPLQQIRIIRDGQGEV